MNAEIICVGTELLLGDILNTNAQFISRRLSGAGINLFYQTAVGDNDLRLEQVLKAALSRSDLVIMTGGLGPTYDDMTKETVCRVMGAKLVLHAESLERIKAIFLKRGRPMTKNNEKQALQPESGVIFENDRGTAPGCAVERDGRIVIMLPGPPSELEYMYINKVEPYLSKFSDGVIVSKSINVFGMGESAAESLLRDLMDGANPSIAPYAKDGEVLLRVTAKAESREKALCLIEGLLPEALRRLGRYAYGVDAGSLEESVVSRLKARGLTVSCAESCTGGLSAKRITDVPGSSEVFGTGIVAYANETKCRLLGVPARLIENAGAVSPEVAKAMATGVRRISGSDFGIGITGIAGPSGGREGKPVGLVCCALAFPGGVWVKRLECGEDRQRSWIRNYSASFALDMLRRCLDNLRSQ